MNYQQCKCIPELLKLVSSLNKFISLKLIRPGQHFPVPSPRTAPKPLSYCFLCLSFEPSYSPLGNFIWIPYNWPWLFPSVLAFVTGTIHHVPAFNSISGVMWNLCLFDYVITFYTTVRKIIWETNEMIAWKYVNEFIYRDMKYIIVNIFPHIYPKRWSEGYVFHQQHSQLSAATGASLPLHSWST